MRLGAAVVFAVTLLVPAIAAAQSPPPGAFPAPSAGGPPPGLAPAFPPGAPGGPAAAPPPPAYYPPGYYPAPAYYGPYGGQPYLYPPPGSSVVPPATLPFDDGQTVPFGYKVKARPVRSLVVTGSILFGATYLASVIGGATVVAGSSSDGKSFAPMFAPVVGPFITVGTAGASGAGALWLVLDGLAQTGGAAMLIWGMVAEEKFLERLATGQADTLDVLAHPQVLVGARSASLRWTL